MLSALALARRIEAGELTPGAVVDMCAQATAAKEAEIGAFAALNIEGARRAADALARMPLRGLPVGMKDIFDTVDFPTAYGSPIYAGHRPETDAAMVMLVRRSGGVVLGKTVTTEFASLQPAGTRNPRNPAHTPGGSSSGSAAAVAAGMVPIAFGSQTGGSVIRPGSYCGVAAYKPSYRLLPTIGMKAFSPYLDTVGVFGARIEDVAFAAAAVTGRDLHIDGATASAPSIALVRTSAWPEATPDMQAALESAARAAEASGGRVKEVVLPELLEQAMQCHRIVQDYEAYRTLAYEYDRHHDQLGPILREQLGKAAAITHDDYDAARRTTRMARQAFANLMAGIDVILTPSAPDAAPRGLESTGKPTFNRLWTLLGPPCINVPGLTDGAGLPLGVQLVGRFARDKVALAAAVFLETALARRRR
jgi:Asp-tRNA(Asn)/Glu-tRNA(Gln) amidotransferase A subunit family amidase